MKKRTFLKLSSAAATGAILSPMVGWTQENTIRNWAGNITYSSNRLAYVATPDEARSLVMKYPKLKVLGTRHCFNTIADSKDQLISLIGIVPTMQLDAGGHFVTVGAGVRYGQLAEYLYKNGFALHNLASLPHISVAGACVTGTHGSGNKNGNLSTAVAGMEMINASGETLQFHRDKDGEQFQAAVVNLGALGVLTKLTLDVQPSYQVSQVVYENLSLPTLEQHFDEIMSAGYSVSLFTDWKNKNFSEVWIKRRVAPGTTPTIDPEFFGARAATKNVHPIIELSAMNCTEQMGVPGPWHERLPHFKMGFTPSSGNELQSEYFVPREMSYKALLAVERLHEQVSPLLMITEIRTIDADRFWMSPCYERPSTTIHFTWKPDWPGVRRVLPLIEEQLAPFHARPHWGKLFTVSPKTLSARYPKLADFRKMAEQMDPSGKFRNAFLDNYIFGA
ncbi:MAG TPA: D-arabinono-1,4-lactone oxidase [Puia sp.]|nr:D-arabinono-1,4-lactone oxidase [Puia sp.]